MTTDTTARKDTQKLQRAIVDGLEKVKAQDIQVFDTEHLSPLFERVIVASGSSNRQTKALAASVRDAVRAAGFPKPRIEGEANGEWIIVDCAQVVAHIMQPNFRSYYQLEELWGEKPVRMRFGAPKPAAEPVAKAPSKAARTPAKAPAKAPVGKTAAVKTPANRPTTKTPAKSAGKAVAAKAAARPSRPKAPGAKVAVAKPAAARPAAKRAAATSPAARPRAAKR